MHHMEKKHKIPSIKAKFRFLTNLKCRKKEEKIQYAGQDIKKSQVSMMLTPERKDKKSSNESVYLPLSELVQKTVDLKPPAFDLLPSRKRLHPRRSYGKQTFLTAQDKKILQEKGFTVDKSISFGCSGSLYLMFYQPSKKTAATKLAVKVVDRALVAEKFIKKFLPREIAIVSELNHPHIIQCHSIMDVNTKCLFFMRFAENGDLLDYLGKTGVADETQGRMWVRQILLALDYLHKKLIAHRDIKCENLLVTQNLNIMLADFGFARKWVDADGEEVLSDTYCGSVSYAAPEILAGKPYCPKRVDVWSLGVVTFVMFNFAKPFPQKVHVEALRAQWSRNYRWNSKGNRVSGNAKAFVALMLEPKYTIRPFPYQLLDEFWMKEDPELLKLLPFKKSIK